MGRITNRRLSHETIVIARSRRIFKKIYLLIRVYWSLMSLIFH